MKYRNHTFAPFLAYILKTEFADIILLTNGFLPHQIRFFLFAFYPAVFPESASPIHKEQLCGSRL